MSGSCANGVCPRFCARGCMDAGKSRRLFTRLDLDRLAQPDPLGLIAEMASQIPDPHGNAALYRS